MSRKIRLDDLSRFSAEPAASLGGAIDTACTQLRSLFCKMGTSLQADLVSLTFPVVYLAGKA